LKHKQIFLEQENFDILKLLQHKQTLAKGKEKRKDSLGEVEKAMSKKTGNKRQKTEVEPKQNK